MMVVKEERGRAGGRSKKEGLVRGGREGLQEEEGRVGRRGREDGVVSEVC